MRISDWSSDVCSSDLFPVILDEADIVPQRIDPDHAQAFKIKLLNVRRAGFEDDLILVIMLQAVGVFAIAAIGRAAAWLDEGGIPRLRPQCAQSRGGVKRPRAHAHVIGLKDRSEEHTSELQS